MKKFFFIFGMFFVLFLSETKASTVVDSIQKTTTSLKVFYHWDFNAPDSTGKVGVQIATNVGFTTGIVSDPFNFMSVDTGHTSYTFSGLTPNTQYWVRARELTCLSCSEVYSGTMSAMTLQMYYASQVLIDSITRTSNSQTVYYSYKCGNDTLRIKFQFAENSLSSGPFYTVPDVYYGTYNTNTWMSGQFTVTGLDDTTYHEVSATAYNRAGSATDVDGAYTLAIPAVTTPFVVTDSANTTNTTATLFAHGYTTGTYGFRVYGSASDASLDNAGINHVASGPISGFSKTISGFTPSTQRWYRAYINDGSGTILGSVKSFTTSVVPAPIISLTMVATGTTTATGSAVVTTTYAANVVLKYNGNQSLLSSGATLTGTNLPISLTGLTPGTVNYYYVGVTMFAGDTTWKTGTVATSGTGTVYQFEGEVTQFFADDHYFPLDTASVQIKWKGTNVTMWVDLREYNNPSTIQSSITSTGLTSASGGAGWSYDYIDLNSFHLGEKIYEFRVMGYSDGGIMYSSPWVAYDLRNPSTGISDMEESKISIYPNPTTDKISISLPKDQEVQLLDLTGKLIEKDYGSEILFNMSALKSGIYYLRIGDITTKKIIKQ